MKRSRRLLRNAHARRHFRVMKAAGRGDYDAMAETRGFGRLLCELAADGHLDREPLGNPIETITFQVDGVLAEFLGEGHLVEEIGQAIAARVFAEQRSGGGLYRLKPADRELSKGCMALAEAAVVDRLYRVLGRVLRTRAAVHHRDRPCWPRSYLERREGERLVDELPPIGGGMRMSEVDESGVDGHTEASNKRSIH